FYETGIYSCQLEVKNTFKYDTIISKISQQNIEHIFFFIMLDTAFYREKLNENRFVIFIYYECRYAQFALSYR
ncbi:MULTISPECIES: hypothetical protein, partial [Blautia]|uniref:hypothetical protein n=1 Tax=Blautia TaxID=572511 RepID=UPI001A9C0D02